MPKDRFKKFFSILGLLLAPCLVQARVTSKFQFDSELTYAVHTSTSLSPASERFFVLAQDKIKFTRRVSAVLSAQGWAEGVYLTRTDYPESVRSEDAYDTRLQDAYLQWQIGDWTLRAGNQQVVWGEAFGLAYADVVNPRDMRYGIPLNFSRIRLSSPMLNVKYAKDHTSAQFVYLFQPKFNILPLPGADYLPQIDRRIKSVTMHRQTELPWEKENGEYGLRLTQTINPFDLSLFAFNYFYRSPYYTKSDDSQLPDLLIVDEHHSRVTTFGFAAAGELDGYVLRSEFVVTPGERIATFDDDNNLGVVTTTEVGAVLSIDLPTWKSLNTSFQWNESLLGQDAPYLSKKQRTDYLNVHTLYSFATGSTWESVITYALHDHGVRLLTEYLYPFASAWDAKAGLEYFIGDAQSEFGKINRASRTYVQLRYRY